MGVRALAAVTAVFLALWPALASAHEENALHALTVIHDVTPDVEGIEVRIVHLDAPALVVRNDSPRRLTVLGADGELFLEIARGRVRANAESPTTYLSSAPGAGTVPPGLRPAGEPRWINLSKGATWTWFDPRLRSAPDRPEWEIQMLLDGQPIVVEGGFESLHGHGHFLTEIQAPEVAGLDLRIAEGPIPALFVRNDTGKTLAVPGDYGEPMLRITPRGVLANLRSPTYYTSGSTSILEVPKRADADALPRWRKVSRQPVWSWLERGGAVPAELLQRAELGDQPHAVLEWTESYRLGDETIEVAGRVDWVPPVTAPPEDETSGLGESGLVYVLGAVPVLAFLFVAGGMARRYLRSRT